jgi:hypothetical protein
VKFGIGDIHGMPLSGCEFHEDWGSKSQVSLWGVDELLSVVSTFVPDFAEAQYKKSAHNSVDICVLWGNRRRKGSTFLVGVN